MLKILGNIVIVGSTCFIVSVIVWANCTTINQINVEAQERFEAQFMREIEKSAPKMPQPQILCEKYKKKLTVWDVTRANFWGLSPELRIELEKLNQRHIDEWIAKKNENIYNRLKGLVDHLTES